MTVEIIQLLHLVTKLKTYPLPPRYLIFLDKLNDIVSFSYFEMEAFQDYVEEKLGASFADTLQNLGEVLSLCFCNFAVLLCATLMMKCLVKKKSIESSKFLNGLKLILEKTIKGLQWSPFYLLFIEGYKDLLVEII